MTAEYLVPTDVETTGLEPSEGHKLLEIAVYIAEPTAPFGLIDEEGFHAIIKHDRDEVYAVADDYVRDMHNKTGLWDKVENGTPLEEVDEQLLAYLQQHLGKRAGRIFGNSVRLDMNFMQANLPKSMAWLHYRFLDATGLAWYAHRNFGVPYYEKKRAHTAEEDIRESLSELAHVHNGIVDAVSGAGANAWVLYAYNGDILGIYANEEAADTDRDRLGNAMKVEKFALDRGPVAPEA